jgi:Domain of unknown function (DUF5615)
VEINHESTATLRRFLPAGPGFVISAGSSRRPTILGPERLLPAAGRAGGLADLTSRGGWALALGSTPEVSTAHTGMKFLIDENLSSPCLASRLRAQGHDPVLARDVGLLSVTDARVLIFAFRHTQSVNNRVAQSHRHSEPCMLRGPDGKPDDSSEQGDARYPPRPGGKGAHNDGRDRGGGCQRVRAKEILGELLCGLQRPASRHSRVG